MFFFYNIFTWLTFHYNYNTFDCEESLVTEDGLTQIDRQESNCRRLWRPRRSLSKQKVQIITIANASANCSGYGEDAIASYCLHCLFYPVLSLCFHHKTFRVEQKKKPSGCRHDNRRAGIILFHINRERNLTCRPDTSGRD